MTHAFIVATAIDDSNQRRFVTTCLSRGANNLFKNIRLKIEQRQRQAMDRNIERHEDGLWYKRVRVVCDCDCRKGSKACELPSNVFPVSTVGAGIVVGPGISV